MITKSEPRGQSVLSTAAYKFLPPVYRLLLRLTRRRGLQTVGRLHFSLFRDGGVVDFTDGSSMFIPGDKHFVGYLVELHEDHIDKVLRESVRHGDTCVDVGANIGYFAVKMARRAGPTGAVYCYEPDVENYAVLHRNAKEASKSKGARVEAKNAAVTASASLMKLLKAQECTGHQVSVVTVDENERDLVQAVALDEEIPPATKKIALIKVDVEGHELEVLKGAKRLIEEKAARKWILEVWPGADAVAIGSLLENAGYRVRVHIDGAWIEMALENLPYRTDLLAELGDSD